jgi:hypothetical protein
MHKSLGEFQFPFSSVSLLSGTLFFPTAGPIFIHPGSFSLLSLALLHAAAVGLAPDGGAQGRSCPGQRHSALGERLRTGTGAAQAGAARATARLSAGEPARASGGAARLGRGSCGSRQATAQAGGSGANGSRRLGELAQAGVAGTGGVARSGPGAQHRRRAGGGARARRGTSAARLGAGWLGTRGLGAARAGGCGRRGGEWALVQRSWMRRV